MTKLLKRAGVKDPLKPTKIMGPKKPSLPSINKKPTSGLGMANKFYAPPKQGKPPKQGVTKTAMAKLLRKVKQ